MNGLPLDSFSILTFRGYYNNVMTPGDIKDIIDTIFSAGPINNGILPAELFMARLRSDMERADPYEVPVYEAILEAITITTNPNVRYALSSKKIMKNLHDEKYDLVEQNLASNIYEFLHEPYPNRSLVYAPIREVVIEDDDEDNGEVENDLLLDLKLLYKYFFSIVYPKEVCAKIIVSHHEQKKFIKLLANRIKKSSYDKMPRFKNLIEIAVLLPGFDAKSLKQFVGDKKFKILDEYISAHEFGMRRRKNSPKHSSPKRRSGRKRSSTKRRSSSRKSNSKRVSRRSR